MISMLRAPVHKLDSIQEQIGREMEILRKKPMPKTVTVTETKIDFLGSLTDWTWERSWSLRMYK